MSFKKALFQKKWLLFNSNVKTNYVDMMKAQSMSVDQLAELNWQRRVQLVKVCAEKVPFYQRKFKEVGFEPGDLKSESDYARLPVLEKQEIRDFQDELVNVDFDKAKLSVNTTGGSTGAPLKTLSDPNLPVSVICWRTLGWWGVNPSDNAGYLYRAIPQGIRRLIQSALIWPTRRRYIHASSMDDASMQKFYEQLKSISTLYLVGYVGALDVFCTFLDRNGLTLPSLKAIWTTAAPLPVIKRDYMSSVFKCPVYTQYGSCEFYWIAAECAKQSGMHIASDIRHVDVVEGDQPVVMGESGDLLVTNLVDHAFPLLRYRLGDRGRLLPDRCECGLPFAMMDYVKGRITDSIRLRNGQMIPGEYWTTIFDDYVGRIKSFRVWQKADYSIEVQFEPLDDDYAKVIEAVESMLNDKLENQADLSFVRAEVDVNDQGKTRFVQSDVPGS